MQDSVNDMRWIGKMTMLSGSNGRKGKHRLHIKDGENDFRWQKRIIMKVEPKVCDKMKKTLNKANDVSAILFFGEAQERSFYALYRRR